MIEAQKFCASCGAEVVRERITLRKLIFDFFSEFFGWDNKYFITIKTMLSTPQIVIGGYIEGIRKKFMKPLPFMLISVTIATLAFNIFSDRYIELNQAITIQQQDQIEGIFEQMAANDPKFKNPYKDPNYKQEQIKGAIKVQKFLLKYFNLIILIALPIYTLLTFLVFGKKFNYGEHLVANTYVIGVTFLFTTVVFLLSVLIHPSIYLLSMIFTFLFYTYAFKKLYGLDAEDTIIKILKFFGLLIIVFILFVLITLAAGFLAAMLSNMFK